MWQQVLDAAAALGALGPWILSGWDAFVREFPTTALNSLVFGVVIGGFVNLLSRWSFFSKRFAIAGELSELHKSLLINVAKVFEAFSSRDVSAYKEARQDLRTIKARLTEFQLLYGRDFTVRQMDSFKQYDRRANRIIWQLVWERLGASMQANGKFKLEDLGWLSNEENFKPLKGTLGAFDLLANDFFRSLWIWWWRRMKLRARVEAEHAEQALKALFELLSKIAPATAGTAVGRAVGDED